MGSEPPTRGATNVKGSGEEVGRKEADIRCVTRIHSPNVDGFFCSNKEKGKIWSMSHWPGDKRLRPKYESDQGRSGIEVLKLNQSFPRNSSILLTSTRVKSCLETASFFLSCSCSWRSHIFPPVKPRFLINIDQMFNFINIPCSPWLD